MRIEKGRNVLEKRENPKKKHVKMRIKIEKQKKTDAGTRKN